MEFSIIATGRDLYVLDPGC